VADSGTTYERISEDEFVYDVAVRLKALLENHGYTVKQTVYDADTGHTPQKTLKNGTREYLDYGNGRRLHLKKKYLSKRCALMDNLFDRKADPIMVSLHINYKNRFLGGATIYYPDESYGQPLATKRSKTLAKSLNQQMADAGVYMHGLSFFGMHFNVLPVLRHKFHGDKDFKLAHFKLTGITNKVLIELANIKTPSDAARMYDPDYRQRLAYGVFRGIVAFDPQP